MIYNFFIYSRDGTCLYYKEWYRETKVNSNEEQKLMFGMLFSLKRFVSGVAPVKSDTFYSFKTSGYKLHYYETASGYKFIMLTDSSVGDLQNNLKYIYSHLFVNYVTKNPLQKHYNVIDAPAFEAELDPYVRGIYCFK
eukprot:gb/GECH01001111.1/.p1 GENE.gb/GECH01001111.1/~~gb/GECH01001111.1/.p1  ORF type:complete len:138 (+),score=26.75 gb/GECH01001111.1/:1-414(+)